MDQLNAELRETEEWLAQLGETAYVEFGSLPDGRRLTFKKIGSAWRLVYTSVNGQESPLLSTSKKVRLDAVARMPALLEAIRAVEDARVEQIAAACAALREFRNQAL